MKNTLLWSAIFTLISTPMHADIVQQVPAPTPPAQTTTNPPQPASAIKPDVNVPAVTLPFPPKPTINCEYKFPQDVKQIDQTLVISWSEKAVVQAFSFDPNTLDMQLEKLQKCFTDQGWISFTNALQKSGNRDAIKAQRLTVSSQLDGQVQVKESKENQWKINLPLQVVYQNDKEKVTQLLNIDLTVSRKTNGDLGITQMIAEAKEAAPINAPENKIQVTPDSNDNATPPASKSPTATTTPTPSESPPNQSEAPTAPEASPQPSGTPPPGSQVPPE